MDLISREHEVRKHQRSEETSDGETKGFYVNQTILSGRKNNPQKLSVKGGVGSKESVNACGCKRNMRRQKKP